MRVHLQSAKLKVFRPQLSCLQSLQHVIIGLSEMASSTWPPLDCTVERSFPPFKFEYADHDFLGWYTCLYWKLSSPKKVPFFTETQVRKKACGARITLPCQTWEWWLQAHASPSTPWRVQGLPSALHLGESHLPESSLHAMKEFLFSLAALTCFASQSSNTCILTRQAASPASAVVNPAAANLSARSLVFLASHPVQNHWGRSEKAYRNQLWSLRLALRLHYSPSTLDFALVHGCTWRAWRIEMHTSCIWEEHNALSSLLCRLS